MRRTVPVQRSFALVGIQDRYLHHSQALFGSSVSARNPLASRRFLPSLFLLSFSFFQRGKAWVGGMGDIDIQKFLIVITIAMIINATAITLHPQTTYFRLFVSVIAG